MFLCDRMRTLTIQGPEPTIGRHGVQSLPLDDTGSRAYHWTTRGLEPTIGRHRVQSLPLDDTGSRAYHWTTQGPEPTIGRHRVCMPCQSFVLCCICAAILKSLLNSGRLSSWQFWEVYKLALHIQLKGTACKLNSWKPDSPHRSK